MSGRITGRGGRGGGNATLGGGRGGRGARNTEFSAAESQGITSLVGTFSLLPVRARNYVVPLLVRMIGRELAPPVQVAGQQPVNQPNSGVSTPFVPVGGKTPPGTHGWDRPFVKDTAYAEFLRNGTRQERVTPEGNACQALLSAATAAVNRAQISGKVTPEQITLGLSAAGNDLDEVKALWSEKMNTDSGATSSAPTKSGDKRKFEPGLIEEAVKLQRSRRSPPETVGPGGG